MPATVWHQVRDKTVTVVVISVAKRQRYLVYGVGEARLGIAAI